MIARVHDPRQCKLGEGPLWHPELQQLFWFDILAKRLLTREHDAPKEWQFDEMVSAAGWIDRDMLLIASETRLFRFSISTGASETIAPLEADNPKTRSNDGRADPQGGFWIGTMGKSAADHAGAIYRYYRGDFRKIYPDISIPNSICFAPDGTAAYFTDTRVGKIMTQPLDADGWPQGAPTLFLDLKMQGLNPDGSVTDADGNLWNAQWGASRVAQYGPGGKLLQSIPFPARHTSCPAFGGPDLTTLYCTTAQEDISPETLAAHPENGQIFAAETSTKGWPEPQVIL